MATPFLIFMNIAFYIAIGHIREYNKFNIEYFIRIMISALCLAIIRC